MPEQILASPSLPDLAASMEAYQWAYTHTLRAMHAAQAVQTSTYAAELRLRHVLRRARLDVARAWVAVCEAECAWDDAVEAARAEVGE